MITFENVTKKYVKNNTEFIALNNINLTIESQEMFGVVGESGSGKSTFLRLINGLESVSFGRVLIDNIDFGTLSPQMQREKQQQIGMIFQHFNLLGNKTVFDNVALPLKLQRKLQPQTIMNMLDFVNMAHKAKHYPVELSGGEKQRVAIARALSIKPNILLCDEPTSALDDKNGEEIMQVLKQVQTEFHTTIVFVSHELNKVKRWCERAAILEKGNLLAVTTISKSAQNAHYSSYYERALAMLK